MRNKSNADRVYLFMEHFKPRLVLFALSANEVHTFKTILGLEVLICSTQYLFFRRTFCDGVGI
jgi:hypothetical protein